MDFIIFPEFSMIYRTKLGFPEFSLIFLMIDPLMQHRNSNKLSTLLTLHHATSMQEIVPCALSIRLCQLKHKIAEHYAYITENFFRNLIKST